jgi:membrane associated rhomboid family serine protease
MSRLVHIGSDGASMAVTMAWTILAFIWRLLWLNPLLWPVLVAVNIALWAFAASFATLVRTSNVAILMLLSAMRCGIEQRNLQNLALRKARRHVISFAKEEFRISAPTG